MLITGNTTKRNRRKRTNQKQEKKKSKTFTEHLMLVSHVPSPKRFLFYVILIPTTQGKYYFITVLQMRKQNHKVTK